MKKIVPLKLVGILVVGVMLGCGEKMPVETSQKPEVLSETKIPEIKVSLRDLLEEYKSDPVAANERYKERTIVTMGEVFFIEDKGKGAEVWIFISPNYLSALVCFFNDKEEVISIKKGEKIAVVGKIKGKEAWWLRLEDCHLRNIEELKEFKVEFNKETGSLALRSFGYDLEVKAKSPEGNLLPNLQFLVPSIKYYENTFKLIKVWGLITNSYGGAEGPPGEYSLLIIEKVEAGNEKLLYEEKFMVGGPEKAEIEVVKIQGGWKEMWDEKGYGYYIEEIELRFANLEKMPIIAKKLGVKGYKDNKLVFDSIKYFGSGRYGKMFYPEEERALTLSGLPNYHSECKVTADLKGGEYPLVLKIYDMEKNVEIKEINVTLKVPPYKG